MDEDPVDIRPAIDEECKPSCNKTWTAYEACVARVEGQEGKHCTINSWLHVRLLGVLTNA
jgi:ubiquinol-cytochrome c reductase subunit 6